MNYKRRKLVAKLKGKKMQGACSESLLLDFVSLEHLDHVVPSTILKLQRNRYRICYQADRLYSDFATSSIVFTFRCGYSSLASKAPPYSGFFAFPTVLSPLTNMLSMYSEPI